jgi:alkylation response protein AidB-like acyl-CoA dehydrogenase
LALRALNVILERARLDRLTRNQHILFRLGEWIALAETAAALARYAAQGVDDAEAKVCGFQDPVVKATSRIYARETALRIASEGLRWLIGAAPPGSPGLRELENALNMDAIYGAQQGLLTDHDMVAHALRESST